MITIDKDLQARLAIRLGHAYKHAWPDHVTQGWNWNNMRSALDTSMSQRLPRMTEEAGISYRHSSSEWLINDAGATLVFFRKEEDTKPLIVSVVVTDGETIRVNLLSDVRESDVWRIDRAITALSEGPWRHLLPLPPLDVLLRAVRRWMPSVNVAFVYSDGKVEASLLDQPGDISGLQSALIRLETSGWFRTWNRARNHNE